MRVAGDVKCYHCGHVSGKVEGNRGQRLMLDTFRPRQGYRGTPPRAGERIRCERCGGPVFLEDLRPIADAPPPVSLPKRAAAKRARSGRTRAA